MLTTVTSRMTREMAVESAGKRSAVICFHHLSPIWPRGNSVHVSEFIMVDGASGTQKSTGTTQKAITLARDEPVVANQETSLMAADSAENPKYGPGPSQVTATGRRKRKDHGSAREAGKSWSADEERLFLEALDLCGTQSLVPCEPMGACII